MERLISNIERKLFLKVSKEKSTVAYIRNAKFFGYSFYQMKGSCRLRKHPKSVDEKRNKIRELTSRSNVWGNARRKESFKQYITDWVHYFQLADMKTLMNDADELYRRWLRMVLRKQWKRISTKLANLVKLGKAKSKVWEFANTRKGYWHIGNSWILSTSVTNQRMRNAGYLSLTDCYLNARKI